LKKNIYILKSIINECEKHLSRMNSAFNKIKNILPVTSEKVISLNEDEIEHIDQFIFRFSRLQDTMGEKLFKAVLIELGEEVRNKAAIDIFNKLEQLEIISSYENWKELRELRNNLSHEYEEDENEAAEKLNLLFDRKDKLEKYYIDILTSLKRRGYEFKM
jgi:hypothetical protein